VCPTTPSANAYGTTHPQEVKMRSREEEAIYQANNLTGQWYRDALMGILEKSLGMVEIDSRLRILQTVVQSVYHQVLSALLNEGYAILYSHPQKGLPWEDLDDPGAGVDVSTVLLKGTTMYPRDILGEGWVLPVFSGSVRLSEPTPPLHRKV
jgi:hypothetical protein